MAKMKILDIEQGYQSKVICIGFDGCCVKDAYPRIGDEIGAVPVLRKLTETGHRLILSTVRCGIRRVNPKAKHDKQHNRTVLKEALLWFDANNIPLWAVNTNPEQRGWSSSNKIHADLYIDNKTIGAPLISPFDEKPFLDWNAIDTWLERGCYYWNGVR
jgi:hypothetical protein